MNPCKYFDSGWCYAPDDVETGAHQGACCASFCSYYLKKQQMSINLEDYVDKEVIVTYRNGCASVGSISYGKDDIYCQYRYRFGLRWYTWDGKFVIDRQNSYDIVSIVTVEENDKNFENAKQTVETMTEKEEIQSKITSLQKQLAAIEEAEKCRSSAEEAFKDNYGCYPNELKSDDDFICWKGFKRGYEAAQRENVNEVEEPLPAKDKVSLYNRFCKEGAYGCLRFDDALKVVREFLLDEGKIEYEGREYITITLQKSLLEDPNDNLPYFVGN